MPARLTTAASGRCGRLYGPNPRQQSWVDTMIKEGAAQSVVVPS
jgi:hypothetical protein